MGSGSSMINYQDLPVCLDSSAKKVLLPSASMREIGNVPDDLAAVFDFISYRSAEKAVLKALGANPAIITDSDSYYIRTYASILSCKGMERVS